MEEFIIDENSSDPLYYQLYNYLKDCIIKGKFKPDIIIPSENEMISLYDVSRVTIRRAVDELEREGYVKKVRGKGTIILGKKPFTDKNALYGFSETAKMRGDRLSYAIIFTGIEDANEKVMEVLKIPLGTEIFVLRRFLLLNGHIAGLTTAYLPFKEKYSDLLDDVDEFTSLYDRLQEVDIILDWAEETIEMLKSPDYVSQALCLEKNEPVVYSEHKAYTQNDEMIEYTESYYIYNIFKYSFKTKRG